VTAPFEHEQELALAQLRENAQARGIGLELTPGAVMTVPLRGTHPLTPAEFSRLPESVRGRYQSALEEHAPEVQAFLTRMPQGVLIPAANARHLMLSREVVQSTREGLFHVWCACTVDEGIELLTGLPAGRRAEDNCFPEGSLHACVEERLEHWEQMTKSQVEEVSAGP
jgi:hypothetical protein